MVPEAPGAEEPAGDLLPRPNLGERPVFCLVQIDLEGLLVRARYFALHTGRIIQELGVHTSLKKRTCLWQRLKLRNLCIAQIRASYER